MSTLYADPAVLFARALRRCVRTPEGCWQFTGATTSRGYGCVGAGRRGSTEMLHRVAVLASGRAIPDGMTVDHTCHDSLTCRLGVECPHRRCCNPAHLAVVTPGANTARQWEAGVCAKGHGPLLERRRGTGVARYCPTCQYASQARWKARLVAALSSDPVRDLTWQPAPTP